MSNRISIEAPRAVDTAAGCNSHLADELDPIIGQAIGRKTARHPRLADAMRYAVLGGGKRFRARLVLAVSDMLGAERNSALRLAAAIECVHAQSLVHDDLPCMDDDDMRRGRPTLHRAFDEATAVLAGDALLALSFEIISDPATHPDAGVRSGLVLELALALGQDGLAGGQMMDLFPGEPGDVNLHECERRKTGALIRYCVVAGSILSRCDDKQRANLVRFSENLGLIFQIRDDILDVEGDERCVGKTLRKDAARGRKSATTCLGLDGAIKKLTILEQNCHEALSGFGKEADALRGLTQFAASRFH